MPREWAQGTAFLWSTFYLLAYPRGSIRSNLGNTFLMPTMPFTSMKKRESDNILTRPIDNKFREHDYLHIIAMNRHIAHSTWNILVIETHYRAMSRLIQSLLSRYSDGLRTLKILGNNQFTPRGLYYPETIWYFFSPRPSIDVSYAKWNSGDVCHILPLLLLTPAKPKPRYMYWCRYLLVAD